MDPITISSIAELSTVAEKLLYFADGEKFFVFEGDMAAGKTTLIKAFCTHLGVRDVVSSPTFSIVNEYESPNGPVYHFDFYRIKNLREAFDIGYEEYFYSDSYCLIEWPQMIAELLPEHYIKVEITLGDDGLRTFAFKRLP